MPLFETYLIILPLIFLAGLIDSIAGGGGLISLPAYLVAGLPPHNALANNKMSSCFGTLLSTIRYFKHGMIDVKIAVTSALFALIGSFFGTRLVLVMDANFLRYLLILLLPVIVIFTILKKNIGQNNNSFSIGTLRKVFLAILVGLIIGTYDGFFGPGAGSFMILSFTLLLKYDFIMANGNTKVVNFASNIASLIAFVISGKVLFYIGIPAAVVGVLGNHVGSRLVVKNGNKIIKPIFLCVFVMLFGKIVWDLIN